MLKSLLRQGLLALSLAVPWLAAHAQTVPTPTTPAEQDRAKFGHLVEPLLLDPRLTTGRLLDAAMPLTDVTVFTGQENLNGAVPVDSDIPAQQRPGLPPQQPSADAETWRLAYGALLMGAVPAQPYPLTGLPTLNDRLDTEPLEVRDDHLNRYPVVDLLLAYVPYQRLRPDAFSANLLTVTSPDSQLVPVPGAASPFQQAVAFLAAPARLVAHGRDVLFRYQPSRYFVNGSGQQFTTLQVDFGDGQGLQTLPPDSYIRVHYAQPGLMGLHFALTDAAGATVHAYGHLTVTWPDDAVARPATSTGYDAADHGNNRAYHFPLNDPLFQYHENFPDPDPTYGAIPKGTFNPWTSVPQQSPTFVPVTVQDGATVTVSYGGNRSIGSQTAIAPLFHKPIIVVEGFDSWKFDGNENYDLGNFLNEPVRGINLIRYDLSAPTGTPPVFFADHLADNDYDLIFVDFDNGSGDIRRNAMLVANVIEWVKEHYDPTVVPAGQLPDFDEKIVIWGQSMGGLIARFALGYLDQGTTVLAGQQVGGSILAAPQPHPGVTSWVKLLVTRDSPHQGAITSPGLQIGVRKMANVEVGRFVLAVPLLLPWSNLRLQDMVERVRKLHALGYEPASFQLNLYQDRYMANLIEPGTHDFPTAPMWRPGGLHAGNEFRELQYRPMITYPTGQSPTYHTAALSNGSECGTPQPYAPYSEIARFESHSYLNPIVPVGIAAIGAAISSKPGRGTVAGAAVQGIAVAAATLSGKDLDTEIIINSLPDPASGSRRIWHAKVKMWIEIFPMLHFWPFKKIRIPIRLFESDANSPAGMPTYDLAPGGYYENELAFKDFSGANTSGITTVLIDNQVHFQTQPDWAFVPTASAIDYEGPGSTYSYNSQTMPGQDVIMRGFTDDGQTQNVSRLADFVAQEPSRSLRQNTRHIQFTTRSARYVYGLITQDATLTSASCASACGVPGISIVGPNNVCAGGATYTADPVLPNVKYDWGTPAGLREISRSADGSSITYGRIDPSGAPSNSPQVITLDVAKECQSFERATKTVWTLDTPSDIDLTSDIIKDDQSSGNARTYTIELPEVPGAASYSWVVNPQLMGAGYAIPSFSANSDPLISSKSTPPRWEVTVTGTVAYFHIDYTAHSNCTGNTSDVSSVWLLHVVGQRNGDPDFIPQDPIAVYPNAADVKFEVHLVNDSTEIWPDNPTLLSEFKLYDMYGTEQISKTELGKETEIFTQNLPNGPYILRVRRGDRYEMKRISVEH